MKPTTAGLLASLALAAGGLGWALAQLMFAWRAQVIAVGWGTAATLGLIAASLAFWTLSARPRLLRRKGAKPMPPLVAARTAALALACSRTGSISGGTYLGILIGVLPRMPAATARADMWTCALGALASAALVAVALWLESLCHIKGGGDGERGGNAPIEPAGA